MSRLLKVSAVPVALVLGVTCLPLLAVGGGPGTLSPTPHLASAIGIDPRLFAAYQSADRWCDGLRWELLAGIGWVESRHASTGGATVDQSTGTVSPAVLGPPLDGTTGRALRAEEWAGQWGITGPWQQAVGPMQFLPGTFSAWAVDGDGDGTTNPHDVDDAVPTAANYLCGGRDGTVNDERQALRRYNNDDTYVEDVIAYADSLARGLLVVGGTWLCPVAGPTSFVDTWLAPRAGGRLHRGVDMFAAHGAPVVAPVGGDVEHFDDALGGLSFRLWGDDGNYYFGTHLSRFGPVTGHVEAGTIVGHVGRTGNAVGTGAHLHFEIHPGRVPGDGPAAVNPTPAVAEQCAANREGYGVAGGE
ncbi:MAG: peptidoglycan DD-metalloendopeptidase family protein [Acidimicrobiia bacterium]